MCGLRSDDWGHLNARRARTDDANALAGKTHRLARPAGTVMKLALERVFAGKKRLLGRRKLTDRQDQELCLPFAAIFGGNAPRPLLFAERRPLHAGAELDVAPQIEPIGNMVDIAEHLRLGGISFRPPPFLFQLGREHVGIIVTFYIATSAWITVEVPDSAQLVAGLKHRDR